MNNGTLCVSVRCLDDEIDGLFSFYFLLLMCGRENIVLKSNLQNENIDGFTRFEINWIQNLVLERPPIKDIPPLFPGRTCGQLDLQPTNLKLHF